MNSTNRKRFEDIFMHDIEAAAFVIVAAMLFVSVTTYAIDVTRGDNENKVTSTNRIERNPIAASLQDINGDGVNDIVLVHKSGQREIVITSNK